jgi:hypothetical protein
VNHARFLSVVLVVVVLLCVAPSWPTDWDGVGFLEAARRFDLVHHAPHAPGYPVYVLATRWFCALGASPLQGCVYASALGGMLVAWAFSKIVDAPWGAWFAMISPVFAMTAVSPRSDALGCGLACLAAVWVHRKQHTRRSVVLLSLAVGARPGLVVLVASIGAVLLWQSNRRQRSESAGVFVMVSAVWALWLMHASGGIENYRMALETQARGHFGAWGGSAWTVPGWWLRVVLTVRALGDCLAGITSPWRGVRLLGLAVFAVWGARRMKPRTRGVLAAMVLPYTVVAAITQNVGEEPRHMLPLALGVLMLVAVGVREFAGSRRWEWAPWVVAGALCAVPLGDLVRYGREVPPGIAVADVVRTTHRDGDTLVLGGRSARLIAWRGTSATQHPLMGEADLSLERLNHLPHYIYLTEEILGWRDARGRIGVPQIFCRGVSLDRRDRCIRLHAYDVRRR